MVRACRRANSASTSTSVVKTLVLQDDQRRLLLMLMHGDREVSLKALARTLGVKRVDPADAGDGAARDGLPVRRHLAVRYSSSRCRPMSSGASSMLPRIYINGGARGLLVSVSPEVLSRGAAGAPGGRGNRALTEVLTCLR